MAQQLEASLILRVSAVRDSSLGRVLNGNVDAARRSYEKTAAAKRKQVDSNKAATREEVEAEKAAILAKEQTAKAAAKRELREKRRGEEEKRREAERTARKEVQEANRASAKKRREAERTAAAIKRAEEKARREAEATAKKQIQEAERAASRRREAFKNAVMGAGAGAVVGTGMAALTAARRAQALSGAADPQEQLRIAAVVDDKLTRATKQGGIYDQKDRIKQGLVEASVDNQIPQEELAQGVQSTQERYAKFLETFSGMLDDFAAAAQATESDVSSLMLATAATMQAGGLTTRADARTALEQIVATSNQGAVSVNDFAGPMAPIMGLHAMNSSTTGQAWVREFNALAQQLGASGAKPDQIGTLINQFGERLNDPSVRKGLAKYGVQTTVDGTTKGDLLPEREIIRNLEAQKERLLAPGVLKKITGADEVSRAFRMVMQPGAENFAQLEQSSGGREFIQSTRDALVGSAQGRLRQSAYDAQATTTRTGASTMEKATPWAEFMNRFEANNPILSQMAGPLTGIAGMAGLGGLGKVAWGMLAGGGATAAGGLAAAEGAAATGAAAAGGGGILAGLSGLGSLAAAGGTALGLGAAATAGLVGTVGAGLTAGTYYAAGGGDSGFHDWMGRMLMETFGPRAQDLPTAAPDGMARPPSAPGAGIPGGGPVAVPAGGQRAVEAATRQAATQQALSDAAQAMKDAAEKLDRAADGRVRVDMTVDSEGRAKVRRMDRRGPVEANVMLGPGSRPR